VTVGLTELRHLIGLEHGLAVVSVPRGEGTVSSTVVNAGVLSHPVGGDDVIGFVVQGRSAKRRRLRTDPNVTVTVRVGWQWVSADGTATVIGPDDPVDGVEVAPLLRAVFTAAGGTRDDWATFDRVMAEERRAAVLVRPIRLYGVTG
jgi:hypothetical protein